MPFVRRETRVQAAGVSTNVKLALDAVFKVASNKVRMQNIKMLYPYMESAWLVSIGSIPELAPQRSKILANLLSEAGFDARLLKALSYEGSYNISVLNVEAFLRKVEDKSLLVEVKTCASTGSVFVFEWNKEI